MNEHPIWHYVTAAEGRFRALSDQVWAIPETCYGEVKCKRSPRPIDVFSLGRLTLFGMVRLCARQGVPGELISEGVATA